MKHVYFAFIFYELLKNRVFLSVSSERWRIKDGSNKKYKEILGQKPDDISDGLPIFDGVWI